MSLDTQNRLDFRKVVEIAQPVYYPEIGTNLEDVSMRYQAVRRRPSVANNLANNYTSAGDFMMNGSPAVPGGPYNDDGTHTITITGTTSDISVVPGAEDFTNFFVDFVNTTPITAESSVCVNFEPNTDVSRSNVTSLSTLKIGNSRV